MTPVISTDDFVENLHGEHGLVVADFYADWCGPCKMMGEHIDKMIVKFPQVKFIKVNVEKTMDLAQRFEVGMLPTLLFLKDGHVIENINGLVDQDYLEFKIKTHLH